jgi:hypothetical protein
VSAGSGGVETEQVREFPIPLGSVPVILIGFAGSLKVIAFREETTRFSSG